MSDPYVGEIRMFAGVFAPAGWAFCDGSIQSIAENDTLFALIGTTYGGDGQTTFALPDLRSRIPVHQSGGFVIGQTGGQESVALTTAQIPAHTHNVAATSTTGNTASPAATVVLAASPLGHFSANPTALASPMAANAISQVGGGQPHNNLMPTLAVNYIISLFGIFPSQA